jgi:hypothetical protein
MDRELSRLLYPVCAGACAKTASSGWSRRWELPIRASESEEVFSANAFHRSCCVIPFLAKLGRAAFGWIFASDWIG